MQNQPEGVRRKRQSSSLTALLQTAHTGAALTPDISAASLLALRESWTSGTHLPGVLSPLWDLAGIPCSGKLGLGRLDGPGSPSALRPGHSCNTSSIAHPSKESSLTRCTDADTGWGDLILSCVVSLSPGHPARSTDGHPHCCARRTGPGFPTLPHSSPR